MYNIGDFVQFKGHLGFVNQYSSGRLGIIHPKTNVSDVMDAHENPSKTTANVFNLGDKQPLIYAKSDELSRYFVYKHGEPYCPSVWSRLCIFYNMRVEATMYAGKPLFTDNLVDVECNVVVSRISGVFSSDAYAALARSILGPKDLFVVRKYCTGAEDSWKI